MCGSQHEYLHLARDMLSVLTPYVGNKFMVIISQFQE